MSAPNCGARDGTSQRLWVCLHLTMARDDTSGRLWACLHLTVWLGMILLRGYGHVCT